MDLFQQRAELALHDAEFIKAVKKLEPTVTELADQLDCSDRTASMLIAIGKALTLQDLSLASERRYSLDRLHELSSLAKRLKNPEVNVEKLRQQLICDCAEMTHRELRAHIRHLIKELNDGYEAHRAWYVRYSKTADADGMKYMIAKMPAEYIERIHASFTPQARDLVVHGHARGEAEGHAMALAQRCLPHTTSADLARYEHVDEHEDPDNPLDLRHRPCFLIPIKDTHFLENGEIANSDGEIIDIRSLVDAKVAEFGFAVATYPDRDGVPRPQQVFGIKRLADAEDRFLTIISHLVCQHADCDIPAVRCEIHHIQAFARGGKTELENLCPLCREHNLQNDDDPAKKKHGRVIKDPITKMVWFDDYKGRQRRNKHRAQEYNGLATAARMHQAE